MEKQTNKQLKRQKKRQFKQQKKQNRQNTINEIRNLLDQKELSLDSSKVENQVALDEIWQTLKNLERLSNKALKNKLEELQNEISKL
jgi:outer membrane PBP1 activator LpoA protein